MTELFRRYVWHNIGLKLISLTLASILWLAVAHDPVAEIAIQVPIEFRNVPENLEINAEYIPQAQIRLSGPERLTRRLQASDVRPEIDLAGVKPGERTFDLTAQQIHKPYELDVVQVVPGQLHLTFDTKMSRTVPIRPRVLGNFVPGYSISSISVDPSVTTISGPGSRVGKIENAITDPVDVSGLMERGTFVTNAYVPDPLIQVVDPGSIRVTVIMQRTKAENSMR